MRAMKPTQGQVDSERSFLAIAFDRTAEYSIRFLDGSDVKLTSTTYTPITGTVVECVDHFIQHHESPGEGHAIFRVRCEPSIDFVVRYRWKSHRGQRATCELEPVAQYPTWVRMQDR